jgi:DNA-3-methyladenine glycosylase I
MIPFFSGFKSLIIENHKDVINRHLPDYTTISQYGEQEVEIIMSDKDMIKNKSKIWAAINNAKTFTQILTDFGSFHNYLESFKPTEPGNDLMNLKKDLQSKFSYFGKITVYHFMTDLGLNVLKPDRVITRIFNRLELIADRKLIDEAVIQGQKFAEEINLPIRYIDFILVKYGQLGEDGVCFEKNPLCNECQLTQYCNIKNQN